VVLKEIFLPVFENQWLRKEKEKGSFRFIAHILSANGFPSVGEPFSDEKHA